MNGATVPRLAAVLAAAVLLVACTTTTTTTSGLPEARDARAAAESGDPERRANVRLELAALYFQRGQGETALEEVNRALTAKPDLSAAHGLRGLILASLEQAAAAERAFQRALQLAPDDGGTMHNYGWFHCQQRRFAEGASRASGRPLVVVVVVVQAASKAAAASSAASLRTEAPFTSGPPRQVPQRVPALSPRGGGPAAAARRYGLALPRPTGHTRRRCRRRASCEWS